MMITCFKDVSNIFTSAYDTLRPGGWLEMQDICLPILSDDGSIEGTALQRWCTLVLEASARVGRSWSQSQRYTSALREARFTEIHHVRYQWPLGPWPKGRREKELGVWCRENFLQGLQGISMAVLTRGLGWSAPEVEVLLAEIRTGLLTEPIHAYIPV
jgi:hypothetical protein